MSRVSRKQQESKTIVKSNLYQTGLYLRLSEKDKQRDISESIKNQKELLLDFIGKKPELLFKKIFIDDGKTGTNFNRPAFLELMSDVKEGKINCIVVKDLSRLGRNYLETGNYIENLFPFLGVRFIAVTDHFDSLTNNPLEFAYLLPLKNIMNENYAQDISKKERTAKSVLRKKGFFLGAYATFGYEKSLENKHKLIIDKEAAEIVKKIYNMVEQGHSDIAIAKHLNNIGVPSPAKYKTLKGYSNNGFSNSTLWYKQAIFRISTSQIYMGNMVQGVRSSFGIRGRKETMSEENWDVVEETHEPIIMPEQFERVRQIQVIRKNKYLQSLQSSKSSEKDANLLRGIVFCADCKKAMLRRKLPKCLDKYRFMCNTHEDSGGCKHKLIKERELLKAVGDILLSRIKLSVDINEKILRLTDDAQIKHYDEQICKLEGEQKRAVYLKSLLYKDFKENILDKREYFFIKEKYISEIESCQQKVQELSESKKRFFDTFTAENISIKQTLKYEKTESLSREMLQEMVERIEIYDKGKICISFKFQDEFDKILKFTRELERGVDVR